MNCAGVVTFGLAGERRCLGAATRKLGDMDLCVTHFRQASRWQGLGHLSKLARLWWHLDVDEDGNKVNASGVSPARSR